MLGTIDDVNYSNMITDSSILVSFDIVKMFPNIDNMSSLEAVSETLSNREPDFPLVDCILEALTLCLEGNNSVFDNVYRRIVHPWALACHVPVATLSTTGLILKL